MINIRLQVSGLEPLLRQFRSAPEVVHREVQRALADSVAMAETESKRRTPVDTGLLRSSIGGTRGWSWVRGFRASVGTNVEYALKQHEGFYRHTVGERKYMEKGAKAAVPFIERRFNKAAENVAKHLTS